MLLARAKREAENLAESHMSSDHSDSIPYPNFTTTTIFASPKPESVFG
jgi:hypothetical protein